MKLSNFIKRSKLLVSELKSNSSVDIDVFDKLDSICNLKSSPRLDELNDLLDGVAMMLHQPEFTLLIMKHFRPLLIDLVARSLLPFIKADNIDMADGGRTRLSQLQCEKVWESISLLLPSSPQILPIVQCFLLNYSSPFDGIMSMMSGDDENSSPHNKNRLKKCVQTCEMLVCHILDAPSVDSAAALWNWGGLWRVICSTMKEDNESTSENVVVISMSNIFQRIYGLDDASALAMRKQLIRDPKNAVSQLGRSEANWWHESRATSLGLTHSTPLPSNKISDTMNDADNSDKDDDDDGCLNLPVHPAVCNIAGTLLLKQDILNSPGRAQTQYSQLANQPAQKQIRHQTKGATTFDILGGLVLVPSARRNLSKLAKLVANGGNKPVLLVGAPGAGKSLTFHAIASACERGGGGSTGDSQGLLELHLDDSVDAKSLLGGYVCGEKPGEFVWQVRSEFIFVLFF